MALKVPTSTRAQRILLMETNINQFQAALRLTKQQAESAEQPSVVDPVLIKAQQEAMEAVIEDLRIERASHIKSLHYDEAVIQEVRQEREVQDLQWGGANHDDEHTVDEWISYIAHQATKEGPPRERLIKIAALAIAAAGSIDRKAADESSIVNILEPEVRVIGNETITLKIDSARAYHQAYERFRESGEANEAYLAFNLWQEFSRHLDHLIYPR